MITSVFINLGYYIINTFISIFPSGSGFPASWHTACATLGGYLHMLDPFIPIDILLSCLSAVILAEIAIYGFKTFKWVFSHVPFIGGRG